MLLKSLLYFGRDENLAKINKRVSDYKLEVRNPPRTGKKLLVLDVDYTIFGMFNKLTSVFYASVLLLVINFVITLSK